MATPEETYDKASLVQRYGWRIGTPVARFLLKTVCSSEARVLGLDPRGRDFEILHTDHTNRKDSMKIEEAVIYVQAGNPDILCFVTDIPMHVLPYEGTVTITNLFPEKTAALFVAEYMPLVKACIIDVGVTPRSYEETETET